MATPDAPDNVSVMHYETITTNDGCPLAFQTSLPLAATSAPPPASSPSLTCILLLHGFSGSSAYFTRNFAALAAAGHWIVAPDMRGHGRSGHNASRGGFHVARLAADLRELLLTLHARTPLALSGTGTGGRGTHRPVRFVPVGCSIGAAVVWTYLELFGETSDGVDFAGYVFVDQAPLQDRALLGLGGRWDAQLAHKGCFDEASLLAAQKAWARPASDRVETHAALVKECLGYRYRPHEDDDVSEEQARQDEEFFAGISEICDGVWLARLMADHTRYDHREALESITRPVLVMAGRRSGCFTLEGMEETVKRVKKGGKGQAEMAVFDQAGHWLFYEEAEVFNDMLLDFVEDCTRGVHGSG